MMIIHDNPQHFILDCWTIKRPTILDKKNVDLSPGLSLLLSLDLFLLIVLEKK